MPLIQNKITPTYKKENGLWVLNLDQIQVPFDVKERSVVSIPPGQIGGNHQHPRTEAFVGMGEGLELIWKEDGVVKKTKMNPSEQLILFILPPHLEHAVRNNSTTSVGILIEFADSEQKDVEAVEVV